MVEITPPTPVECLDTGEAVTVDEVIRKGKRTEFRHDGERVFTIRHIETDWYTDEFENHLLNHDVTVLITGPEGLMRKDPADDTHAYDPYRHLQRSCPSNVASCETYPPDFFIRTK